MTGAADALLPGTAAAPRVDAERLWSDILTTARFGPFGETGMDRLALSGADGEVRDWFAAECRALGCTVETDQIGNMFATWPGQDQSLPPIAVGSHLDTQPAGGRFDGILGVLAGVELIRALRDARTRLRHPVTVVNWTNEEGSRFSPAMMGSGVYTGAHELASIEAISDKEGVTVRQALDAIGHRGDHKPGHLPFGAYLELHIEQGPVLENTGRQIGVVTGVQGVCWLDITVPGVDAHAGSRPMGMREDALVAAAHIIHAVEASATAHAPGVGTIGFIRAEPNSRNVVPGRVSLEVDLRHPDETALKAMEDRLITDIRRLSPKAEVRRVWWKAPIAFAPELVDIVRAQTAALGYSAIDMVSGAGHDAAHIASVAPSAMVFIPSHMGLSHNVLEYSSPEQCAEGTSVLLRAVVAADRHLHADTFDADTDTAH